MQISKQSSILIGSCLPRTIEETQNVALQVIRELTYYYQYLIGGNLRDNLRDMNEDSSLKSHPAE